MISDLINENLKQLGDIPRIVKRIEQTEFNMPHQKNMLLRFYQTQKQILLDQIKFMQTLK